MAEPLEQRLREQRVDLVVLGDQDREPALGGLRADIRGLACAGFARGAVKAVLLAAEQRRERDRRAPASPDSR